MAASFAMICWKDKILLFHRDDIPTIPAPDHWQLPGGGAEENETPLETLKRELQEEVSYVPKDIRFITKFKQAHGIIHLYICFVDNNEAKLFKHGVGEGQEIGFFTIDEALKLKLNPTLKFRFEKYDAEIREAMKTKSVPKNVSF